MQSSTSRSSGKRPARSFFALSFFAAFFVLSALGLSASGVSASGVFGWAGIGQTQNMGSTAGPAGRAAFGQLLELINASAVSPSPTPLPTPLDTGGRPNAVIDPGDGGGGGGGGGCGSSFSVGTVSATSITTNSATLRGSANPGCVSTTGFFRYSNVNPGSCNDTFGIRAPLSGGASLGSGSSNVAYSQGITGLSPSTQYFFCALASTASGTSGGGLLTFTTSALSPNPNLSINDVSLNEGGAGATSFTFTVSLSAPAGPGGVTFDIATADGTATQPSDYTQKSLPAQTIPAGSSTYSFTVLVNGDITPEANETFFVNVINVTGANTTDAQGQGTIVNDDAAPNLSINDVSLNEGDAGTTSFTFTVQLSTPAPAGGVNFDIATADGTAVQPGDYTQQSLTGQTIPAGSSTYSFTVLVKGDTTFEANETFFVNVTNVTNAIVTDNQGKGTIVNDDAVPACSLHWSH